MAETLEFQFGILLARNGEGAKFMQARSKGHLGTATLPRLLQDLWRARVTGILHLSQESTSKQIYFRRGDIVFAGTNLEHERLGERLVRQGMISRSALDLAFRVVERSRERFGRTIVEMGWVSSQEMQQRVAEQIKDIIFSVFSWEMGVYHFERSDHPVDSDLVLELKTAEVLYEGARHISDVRSIRIGIGSDAKILQLTKRKRLDIPISEKDVSILSMVDGATSISQILSVSPLKQDETLRRIYALLLADVLRTANPVTQTRAPTNGVQTRSNGKSVSKPSSVGDEEKIFRNRVVALHAAMTFENLYDRMEIDVNSSIEEIRDAFQEVMKSLEPSRAFQANIEDLQYRLEKIRRMVVEAYKTLSDPQKRRDYDLYLKATSPEATSVSVSEPQNGPQESSITTALRALSPMFGSRSVRCDLDGTRKDAEPHYIDAKRYIDAGRYLEAIGSLNAALRFDPNNAKLHRLLGHLFAQNPGCDQVSREHYRKAIELDPYDVDSHLGLADLLEEAGLLTRAQKVYEKVIGIVPDNEVALRKLSEIAGLPSFF